MKALQAALLIAVMASSACAPRAAATRRLDPGWSVYTNSKYGYEISYPDGYDLWETGLEDERDGASIRIGLKEHEAPVPMLDVRVQPRTPAEQFPTLGMRVPDMEVALQDGLVNGLAAREAQYRWAASGELARVEVYVRGAVFQFMPAAGTTDFHKTDWWAIISTFRFLS